MICRFYVFIFLGLSLAGAAQAFLPPDASAREPQLRAYRQKLNDNYEARMVERRAEAVRAYQRTQADVFTPPWMRGEAQAALSSGSGGSSTVSEKAGKRNHRFLVSIMLLIFLGAVAGWVRHATKESE